MFQPTAGITAGCNGFLFYQCSLHSFEVQPTAGITAGCNVAAVFDGKLIHLFQPTADITAGCNVLTLREPVLVLFVFQPLAGARLAIACAITKPLRLPGLTRGP